MAVNVGTLTAKLKTDTAGFQKGMRGALLQVEAIKAALQVAGKAVVAFAKFMKASADVAGVQQDAMVSLEAALARAGETAAKDAAQGFADFASEMQKVTAIGDEVTIKAASIGASFGITGEVLQRTTLAAADLAAVTGQNLQSAMILLGKAAKGETGTLSRYGIILDKNLAPSEKFEAALAAINKQFGGAAQALAETYSGRIRGLGAAVGDTQEKFGDLVVKNRAFTQAMGIGIDQMQDFGGAIAGVTGELQQFVTEGVKIAVIGFFELKKAVAVALVILQSLAVVFAPLISGMVVLFKVFTSALNANVVALDTLVGTLADLASVGPKVRAKIKEINKELKEALAFLDVPEDPFGGVITSTAAAAEETMKLNAVMVATQEAAQQLAAAAGAAFASVVTGAGDASDAGRSFLLAIINAIQQVVAAQLSADTAQAASTATKASLQIGAEAATAGASAGRSAIQGLPFPLNIAAAPVIAAGVFALIKGFLTKFARGGTVTGGVSGRDSVPALLTPGERVVSVPNTRAAGQALSTLAEVLGMQGGGTVSASGGRGGGFGGLTIIVQSPVGPTTSEIDKIVERGVTRSIRRQQARGTL